MHLSGCAKSSVAYCGDNGLVPYEFDKLLWLIGSGRFYQSKISASVDKEAFIHKMQALTQTIPSETRIDGGVSIPPERSSK